MNISTETREILRNYKTVINARRREMGQKPLTTAQVVDEICDFGESAGGFPRRSLHLSGQQTQVIQGRRWKPPVSPREKPGRLTPAGREAGHAGASPVTLPVCDVSGMFFSDGMTLFLLLLLFFSLLP